MHLSEQFTDETVLVELGQRLERQRIEAGLTQARLAQEAGISKRTLERIESGVGCELVTLVRILRVLRLTEGLNGLVPELPPSPIALLKLKGRQRQRVSAPRQHSHAPRSQWKWGE